MLSGQNYNPYGLGPGVLPFPGAPNQVPGGNNIDWITGQNAFSENQAIYDQLATSGAFTPAGTSAGTAPAAYGGKFSGSSVAPQVEPQASALPAIGSDERINQGLPQNPLTVQPGSFQEISNILAGGSQAPALDLSAVNPWLVGRSG